MWGKPRSAVGIGGFTRYAAKTCINHLKSCPNQPPGICQQARDASPQKPQPRFSPYVGTPWLGATPTPGMLFSGPGSSQMLPPQSRPPSQLNSPALYLQSSTLPSPIGSVGPSPQLSALSFPLINTLPTPYGNPLHFVQSPIASPLYPPTPHLVQLSNREDWSQTQQKEFEIQIARLTASAGLPLSWVDNPEWIDFVHQFLPAAKSPSRRVLTTRLIPHIVSEYRATAKEFTRSQNATIQADGWTGANFHHLLAFMIAVKKKV